MCDLSIVNSSHLKLLKIPITIAMSIHHGIKEYCCLDLRSEDIDMNVIKVENWLENFDSLAIIGVVN
jgi:hypothetical protein